MNYQWVGSAFGSVQLEFKFVVGRANGRRDILGKD